MEIRRRVLNVGITFFLAAATGHLMQNADAIVALIKGEPAPPSYVLTQVEPTVAVLTPVAASILSRVPDFPVAEPRDFPRETFLATRIRLLDTAPSAILTPSEIDAGGFDCPSGGAAAAGETHAESCRGA